MHRIVIISDAHLEVGDDIHPSYLLVKKYIKLTKPDLVVLNGDMLDMSYISSYNEKADFLRENKRLSNDIDMMRKELDFFEKYAKKVLYLQGNHEYRLTKTIERTPNFTHGLLSIDKLLDIDYYIPEMNQPVEIIPSLWCMHGKRATKYTAAVMLQDYMVDIIFGHTHRMQDFTLRTWDRSVTGTNSGCLCSKNPGYGNGRQNNWVNGFTIVDYDDKGYSVNNILIKDNSFIFNDKRWK